MDDDFPFCEGRQIAIDDWLRQFLRIASTDASAGQVVCLEYFNTVAFRRQIEGRSQAAQTGPYDRDLRVFLRNAKRFLLRSPAELHAGPLQGIDPDRRARLNAFAHSLAGMIAYSADDAGKGNGPVENSEARAEVILTDAFDHSPGIHMDRAGRRTGRRLFLDTLGFAFPRFCVVHNLFCLFVITKEPCVPTSSRSSQPAPLQAGQAPW